MTLTDYQKKASRTINTKLNQQQLNEHALFGLCSEVGELHGIYQKIYQGHEFDKGHALKEAGDILWFLAEFCSANDIWLDEVAETNITKLLERYPEGFDADHSIHRKEDDI